MSRFDEALLQEKIVQRFCELLYFKQLLKTCVLYSNRNENKGLVTGAIYKRMGRVAGVPDLTLIFDGDENKLAYIEVKTPLQYKKKNKGMIESQLKFHKEYIEKIGIPFTVVSSVNQFEEFLTRINLLKQ